MVWLDPKGTEKDFKKTLIFKKSVVRLGKTFVANNCVNNIFISEECVLWLQR